MFYTHFKILYFSKQHELTSIFPFLYYLQFVSEQMAACRCHRIATIIIAIYAIDSPIVHMWTVIWNWHGCRIPTWTWVLCNIFARLPATCWSATSMYRILFCQGEFRASSISSDAIFPLKLYTISKSNTISYILMQTPNHSWPNTVQSQYYGQSIRFVCYLLTNAYIANAGIAWYLNRIGGTVQQLQFVSHEDN